MPNSRRADSPPAVLLEAPQASDGAKSAAASAINEFGLNLLRAIERPALGRHPNTIISPISVHIAMAMASDAAAGQTRAEMRHVMGVADDQDEAYRSTIASIWNADQSQLQLADSVWTQDGFPIRSAYSDLMKRHFGADTMSQDFTTMAGPNAVNNWVAQHTNNLITGFMKGPDPGLQALLVNTAHFRATWQTPFEKRLTNKSPFHLAGGTTVRVPVMHTLSAFALVRGADADVMELPYEGDRTSMLVFLPRPGVGLDAVLANMSAARVLEAERSHAATQTREYAVSLPKVLQHRSADLVAPLEAMGVHQAFAVSADLSAMSEIRPLWFYRVTHATYLDVNERFTEAAAATGFRAHGGYGPPPEEFNVDRPYLMAIVDKPTGAILFLAAIRDPRH